MDMHLPGTPVAINMDDDIEDMDDRADSSVSTSLPSSRSGSRPSTGREEITTPELIAVSYNSRPSTGREPQPSYPASPEPENTSQVPTDTSFNTYSRRYAREEVLSHSPSLEPSYDVQSVSDSVADLQARPMSGRSNPSNPASPAPVKGSRVISESISEMPSSSSRPSTGNSIQRNGIFQFITRSTPKLPKSGSRPPSARSVPADSLSQTHSKSNFITLSTPNLPRSTAPVSANAPSRAGTATRSSPQSMWRTESPRPPTGASSSSSSPRSRLSNDSEPHSTSSRPPTVKSSASAFVHEIPLASRTASQAWANDKAPSSPTSLKSGSSGASSSRSHSSMSNMESVIEGDDSKQAWRTKLRPNCFLPHLSEKYLCPACTNVLYYPVQLSNCDHQVCSSCLSEIMRGVRCCPVDRKPVDRSQVVIRHDFSKELSAKTLACPQSDVGCQWIGNYGNFKEHYFSCKHADMNCPNGCGFRGEKRKMDDHIMKECSLRMVTCEFCTRAVRAEKEIDHLKQCPRFPVSCSNSCGKKQIPREELGKHIDEECPFGEIKCPFKKMGCYVTGTRDFIRRHIADDLTNHIEMICQGFNIITDKVTKHEDSIATFGTEIQQIDHRVSDLRKRQGCQLLWKIDNWAQRVVEANSGKKTILRSPPFYTGKYGYKLALTLMPNGDGKAKGRYLSLYVCIVKGEYDVLASWPFCMTITLTLIDQCQDPRAKVDHSYVLKPNPCKENLPFLGRPTTNANPSLGSQSFAPLGMLETRDYVREDVIFIQVLTDTKT